MGLFDNKDIFNQIDNNISDTWDSLSLIQKEQDEITKRSFDPEKIYNKVTSEYKIKSIASSDTSYFKFKSGDWISNGRKNYT